MAPLNSLPGSQAVPHGGQWERGVGKGTPTRSWSSSQVVAPGGASSSPSPHSGARPLCSACMFVPWSGITGILGALSHHAPEVFKSGTLGRSTCGRVPRVGMTLSQSPALTPHSTPPWPTLYCSLVTAPLCPHATSCRGHPKSCTGGGSWTQSTHSLLTMQRAKSLAWPSQDIIVHLFHWDRCLARGAGL